MNSVRAFLKQQLATLFPTVAEVDKADFDRSATFSNLGRQRVMAWVVIVTMPIIALTEIKALLDVGSPLRFWLEYQGIAFLRALFVFGAVVFLLAGRRPTSEYDIRRRHRFFEVGFILFSMVITAVLTGVGQPLKSELLSEFGRPSLSSIGAYLIAAFTFAAFLHMTIRVTLLTYGMAWAFLVIHLVLAQPKWIYSVIDIVNVTLMTLLAVLLSQVIRATCLKEFSHLRLIESQQQQLAMTNARLAESNNKLRRLSFLDPMTGLANRRYLEKYLEREWGRAIREHTPLSLVMMDLDYFKDFNDAYGHQEGDKCLAEIAAHIREVLKRPTDLLARYGGDEFIAVLPNTGQEGAMQVADSIAQAVGNLAILVPNSPHRCLTISLGTASHRPTLGESSETLVAAADRALYQAKLAGRNRFVYAS